MLGRISSSATDVNAARAAPTGRWRACIE